MPKPKIVLVGGGGHALSCLDVIVEAQDYDLVGYVATQESLCLKDAGLSFLGTDDILPKLSTRVTNFHVAIGQIKTAEPRVRAFELLQSLSCVLPVLNARDASIASNVSLGAGVLVGRNAIVNSHAAVGANSIVNSGAIIEHGAKIGEHCHIGPGAIILGDVVIGSSTFIGAGAIVREGIGVAPNSVIGAGVRVMFDYE